MVFKDYTIGVTKAFLDLYYKAARSFSRHIFQRYPSVIKAYLIWVHMIPMLYLIGIHRSLCLVLQGHPQVPVPYLIRVSIDSYVLSYRGTHRPLYPVLQGYSTNFNGGMGSFVSLLMQLLFYCDHNDKLAVVLYLYPQYIDVTLPRSHPIVFLQYKALTLYTHTREAEKNRKRTNYIYNIVDKHV